MSLTRSTTFETYAATSGHQKDVVLAVTQQGTTYYFSTRPMPMGLNSSPVYPMLMTHGSLSEGINIFTKQWQISDINFVLSDEHYYPQSGSTPIRVSELLEGLNGESIKLYQWVDGITDIADCLLIFDGYSLQALNVNKRTARFTAKDRSKLWEASLPTRVVGDLYPAAPDTNLTLPIPILYGDFSVADVYDDAQTTATGLAKALAYEDALNGKYILADNTVNSTGIPYRDTGGPTVLPAALLLNDDDDSGVAWVKAHQNVLTDFQLSATLPGIYADESYIESSGDRDNLVDSDYTTFANLKDRLSDDGDDAEGLALWGIRYESILRQHITNAGYAKAGYRKAKASAWVEGQTHQLRFYLYYGGDGVTDERVDCGYASDTGINGSSILDFSNLSWLYPGDDTHNLDSQAVTSELPGDVWAIGIYTQAGAVGSVADGIVSNQVIMELSDAVLRYYYTTPFQYNIWVNARGKEYGSVIVDGVRDNSYNQFATNEDAAYIVEDMYRTYIGLVDADIDMDSFDIASNSDVETRINITQHTKLTDIVRQLSEQNTFVIAASGAGKLRCVALNNPSPTIATTIKRSQLVDDDFELSKTTFIVNDMDVNSRWQAEYERYLEAVNYTDATSVTNVQTRHASFDWKNIAGSSAAHVAEHYVKATYGLWSNEHIKVQFTTAGFSHSYLQTGDWIEFDADIDNLKKAYGTSWVNKELLIVDTSKTMDGTTITAIELYGNGFPPSSPEPSPSVDPSTSPGNPSLSPSDTAPYGRYIQDATATPIAIPLLYTLTDGDLVTEVTTDSGYIALNDHYCLEFDTVVTPDSSGSFIFTLDRDLTGFPALQHGTCNIYYSNGNSVWTQWGTTRTYTNGGLTGYLNKINVNGDGSSGVSALFWKVHFTETPGDASTVGATELTMNTI